MKNSEVVIRTCSLLPEVYSAESRDFQVFTRLMDAVYNSCKYNADSMRYVYDPRNIDNRLLKLLADKFGIDTKDADLLLDDEIRLILCCLPYLLRNKGSVIALIGLINLYFKVYHITGDYTLSVTNKGTVVQDIQLGDRTIVLGIESIKQSMTLLSIMAKYLLPPGYKFFIYFYTKIDGDGTMEYEDNLTLLYTSNVLNSEIDQEIPDFIRDITYNWTDPNLLDDDGPAVRNARIAQLISAVDAHQIGNMYSAFSKEFFIGYLQPEDKATVVNNYAKASTYDPSKDPTAWDFTNDREYPETVNSYQKFDVVLMQTAQGDTVHKIFIPELRLLDFPNQLSFDSWTNLNKEFPAAAFNAIDYNEKSSYAKNSWCIYSGALYKSLIKITEPEEWNSSHWLKKLEDGTYIQIKRDTEKHNHNTFYIYNLYTLLDGTTKGRLDFISVYPQQMCWRTLEQGALAIVNEVTQIETGTKPPTSSGTEEAIIGTSIGELYFVTTYNNECKLNKLTFKGSYAIDEKLNQTTILNSGTIQGKEFDYCCLFNSECPFLYNKNGESMTETQLIARHAANRLPMEAVEKHLRFNLTDSTYYVGINSKLWHENLLDYNLFAPSAFVNDIAFIVKTQDEEDIDPETGLLKKTGIVTADGTAYGYTRFTIQSGLQIKKNHVYLLNGCPSGGDLERYYLEIDSTAFTTDLIDIGVGAIVKATKDDYKARINIILRDQVEVTNIKFVPELFDLTATLGVTEVKTYQEIQDLLWKPVKEGAVVQNQYLPEINVEDNTVLWRRGGDYYIKYKTSAETSPVWQKYTYPLFFTKIIQTRSY